MYSLDQEQRFIKLYESGNCRSLWAAVLFHHVRDATGVNETANIAEVRGAVAWIESDNGETFNCFMQLCTLLDLDPKEIRKYVRKNQRS